ncbi:FecCD family ABC transporter permease [Mangrovibacillus cuniculi]|nr:iron ABC transporter permease [Mangrovibacillus cuniculi]
MTSHQEVKSRPIVGTITGLVGLVILLFSMAASISLGAADIKLGTVWNSLLSFNPNELQHQIIHELRIPRALASAFVGAALAVSGAIMQGMTRNPLASPSIMGVSDGAAFAIAIVFAFIPGLSVLEIMSVSFLGAGLGALLVFSIAFAAKGTLSPVKLALAGVAVGALLDSISTGIAIHFNVAQDISFWFAGGLTGVTWAQVQWLIPAFFIGLLLALFISRSITILSLGDEVAIGLGQQTILIKTIATISVLLLTGAAVSVAGAVGFIGLIIPHVTRYIVGVDYRVVIPCSAIFGALLLVVADIGSRMVNPPFETPVGAITALVGVPFFLYLARQDRRGL